MDLIDTRIRLFSIKFKRSKKAGLVKIAGRISVPRFVFFRAAISLSTHTVNVMRVYVRVHARWRSVRAVPEPVA